MCLPFLKNGMRRQTPTRVSAATLAYQADWQSAKRQVGNLRYDCDEKRFTERSVIHARG